MAVDPKPEESSQVHVTTVAAIERQLATFVDDLARIVDEHELTYHEASHALRFAAGTLRQQAQALESQ